MRLIIRADATEQVGAGHVMRCATFARAWHAEGIGPAQIFGRVELPFVARRLEQVGVAPIEVRPEGFRDALLLVDTYADAEREWGGRVDARCRVLLDDVSVEVPSGYAAVWNPNASVDPDRYGRFQGTVICGASAIPIREDLPRWRINASSEVAITLGGGRPPELLVDALRRIVGTKPGVFVSTAASMPADTQIVAADDMWRRFVRCGRMLSAAGTTVWEAAAVGIPVALVQVAANQAPIAGWAEQSGVPVVRTTEHDSATSLAAAILAGIEAATALPRVQDGSRSVARALVAIAHRR